jgi:hypothetical protein
VRFTGGGSTTTAGDGLRFVTQEPNHDEEHNDRAHRRAWHMTKTRRDPGYVRTAPVGPNRGSECVTDAGQGRFFPCDSGQ